MLTINRTLGFASYGFAFVLFLIDLPLTAIHDLIRLASNKALKDGDMLTGWKVLS
jgi:hypothetical protein